MSDKRKAIELMIKAERCRENVIRMIRAGGHGHVGGAFSAIDLVAALYFHAMNIDGADAKNPDRDRFLLSAGHKCLAQYGVLAEKDFFEKEILDTYGKLGSLIPGHPDMHKLNGVEANTGALGHGISIEAGIAMAGKLDQKAYRVFVVTGDGELPEGSNWEGAAVAAKFGLDNLVVFVDNNGLQISGAVTEVMSMEPIDCKFRDFGWAVTEIDGNDMEQILNVLEQLPLEKGKPTAVICKTVKAKGLSFGENQTDFHFWNASEELLRQAEAEMEERIAGLQKQLEEMKQ